MYTAPPGPDDAQDERTEESEEPELDRAASTTDANWTGDVAADD